MTPDLKAEVYQGGDGKIRVKTLRGRVERVRRVASVAEGKKAAEATLLKPRRRTKRRTTRSTWFTPAMHTQILADFKGWLWKSARGLDPAEKDDVAEESMRVLMSKYASKEVKHPRTLAIEILKRQIKSKQRLKFEPSGDATMGRPSHPRYTSGRSLKRDLLEHCRASLEPGTRTGGGKSWATQEPEIRKAIVGPGSLRTRLVAAYPEYSERWLARVAILLGSRDDFSDPPNPTTIGEILSREIEAIKAARRRVGKKSALTGERERGE